MLYRNKEWLKREVDAGKSGSKIGREIGISGTIINRWIKKYDLRVEIVKPYLAKDWLTEKYSVKRRDAADIAAEFSITPDAIYYWANRFGLSPREEKNSQLNPEMLYQNRNWLFDHFIKEGESAKEIAEMFGLAEVTVVKWTKIFGLRKMDYRDMYLSLECPVCGGEVVRLRTYVTQKKREGCKNFFCGDECLKKFRNKSIKAVNMYLRQERPETGIERKIREVLEELNVNFRSEEKIALWVCDFFVPDYNLVIETHGDYWHANPEKYTSSELNPMQQERIRNDYFKFNGLQHRGYKVLVLWEKDINECINWCVSQIKESIRAA